MRKKRVLVTGGAGFLGSHLIDRLIEDFHVICLDNFFTGSRENVAHLLDHPSFELVEHDVCFPIDIPVDMIYNLACPASPVHYQADPIQTLKTSVLGALNMLDLAKKYGASILQASTSEIYGDPQVHPQTEHYWGNVNPIGCRSCYDEGKRAAETLFFDYGRKYNIPTKVVRIFNTYGPRMNRDDGRVVSNFIVHALKNEPIPVYGDGLQTRSFCFVEDLIEGFLQMMQTPIEIKGPLNLGKPDEFTIIELASKIIKLTGSESKIIYKPLPSDDPKQRKPDIHRARECLKWSPDTTLEDGLVSTIAYFDRLLKIQEGFSHSDEREATRS